MNQAHDEHRILMALMLLPILLLGCSRGHDTKGTKMDLNHCYVAVADIAVSKAFYTKVFDRSPVSESATFVQYKVGSGTFGIMSEKAYMHKVIRGNNAVPAVQVDDIRQELERLRPLVGKRMDSEVIEVGSYHLFMLCDPDDNVIEFYSICK